METSQEPPEAGARILHLPPEDASELLPSGTKPLFPHLSNSLALHSLHEYFHVWCPLHVCLVNPPNI